MSHVDDLVARTNWGALNYPRARELPALLRAIGGEARWHTGTLDQPSPLWEQVDDAVFDQGAVPDAAYALLPCLMTLAAIQNRAPNEMSLVVGYVLDAALGALPGVEAIPEQFYEGFNRCLREVHRWSLDCEVARFPDGTRIHIVAGRLLAPETLVAAFVVKGIEMLVLPIHCPHCDSPKTLVREGAGWSVTTATDGAGLALRSADPTWDETVWRHIAPFVDLSDDLLSARSAGGTLVCDVCGARSGMTAAVIAAMRSNCPIASW